MTTAVNTRITSYSAQWSSGLGLYVTDCARCGVVFALSTNHEERLRESGGTFYCPNGHSMSFGDSDAARAERERDAARRIAENERAARKRAEDRERTTDYRRRAAVGQVTKMKRRVGRGVCPCCNRTFADLARHMAGQHPEFAESS